MNKMTAANLAVVFGPNLAWSNDKTMVGCIKNSGKEPPPIFQMLGLWTFITVFSVIFYCFFSSEFSIVCFRQSLTSIGPINAFTEYLFSNMHQVAFQIVKWHILYKTCNRDKSIFRCSLSKGCRRRDRKKSDFTSKV